MSEEIRSVERAFALLELLGQANQPLGIIDLAKRSNLPQSTAHRLLATLLQLGYVEQDRESHKYSLGRRALHWYGAVLSKLNLGLQAMPVMKALMKRVDETVHLAILSDGETLYIDRIEGFHTQDMYTQIGKRAPAHCTALGKIMLAYASERIVQETVEKHGLLAVTANTICTPEKFGQELERTRQRGYAVDDEEIELGVRCVAGPIRDFSTEVVAAMSISGPKDRIRPDREHELKSAVLWACDLISTKLGYLDV